MFTIPNFILMALFVLILCLFTYVFYYSYATRHYDKLVCESKELDKAIILKRSQLSELNSRVDFYRNRLDDINREYFSKKCNLKKGR